LTKGKASEIIGLLNEPDDEDLEIIEFFEVNKNPSNETEARRIVSGIFEDEANRQRESDTAIITSAAASSNSASNSSGNASITLG